MFFKIPDRFRLPEHFFAKKRPNMEDSEKGSAGSKSSSTSGGHTNNSIFVRDSIIGFADGLTVPFALTAGLSSLGSSKIVILGGLAELFAGSISMGLGAYLAAKTDRKHCEVVEERKRKEIQDCTAAEAEEVYDIFSQYGIPREASAGVVESLKRDENTWVKFMMDFSLKLEKPALKIAWIEGFVMGISYFFGGLLPMIPYFATKHINEALFCSIGVTVVILLAFGFVKAKVTGCSAKDSVIGAGETLFIGALAASVSYGIVKGINSSTLFDSYDEKPIGTRSPLVAKVLR